MNDKEIELLIDKKVADAKLEAAEKAHNSFRWVVLVLFSIFGIFIPIFLSNQASERVDKALNEIKTDISKTSDNIRDDSKSRIDSMKDDLRAEMSIQSRELANNTTRVDNATKEMEHKFKELAGNQQRKPVLECLSGGTSLEGKIFKISPTHENIVINVKNTGDATAKSIRLRLYTNLRPLTAYMQGDSTQWGPMPNYDEPGFKYAYETAPFPLDPKDTSTVDLNMVLSQYSNLKSGNYPILIKLFYEQSEPRKYRSTINISGLGEAMGSGLQDCKMMI